jgi:hypothetical protein
MFCDKNIIIGETYINEDDNNLIEKIEIYDDDYCPNCNIEGYITKENYRFPDYKNCNYVDCYNCYIGICIFCSNFDKKEGNFICYKCENPNLSISIKNKIKEYNKQDFEKFGIKGNINFDDIKELLNKQKFKCYVCNDIVLTYGYKPYCLYQFTLDRIDNTLPHNRNNVLICCYYCNCKEHLLAYSENKDNIECKICNNNCHFVKRNIVMNRNNVSKEKIKSLLLN